MPDDVVSGDPLGDLFGVDLADFVGVRNVLARTLRRAGDREGADRVAGLRRPSPAAWAVNQLARQRSGDVQALIALGRVLREAQAEALGGTDAQGLRRAARARRDAVVALGQAGVALLSQRGPSADTHAASIVATLEAASLDAQAGEAVLAGHLTTGLEPPSGFGALEAAPSAPRQAEPAEGPDAGDAALHREAARADRQRRLVRAERAVREASALAAGMCAAAEKSAEEVARLERDVVEAQAERERLARELDDARRRADLTERSLADARTTAARCRAGAADAGERVRDAEARVEALRDPE